MRFWFDAINALILLALSLSFFEFFLNCHVLVLFCFFHCVALFKLAARFLENFTKKLRVSVGRNLLTGSDQNRYVYSMNRDNFCFGTFLFLLLFDEKLNKYLYSLLKLPHGMFCFESTSCA